MALQYHMALMAKTHSKVWARRVFEVTVSWHIGNSTHGPRKNIEHAVKQQGIRDFVPVK